MQRNAEKFSAQPASQKTQFRLEKILDQTKTLHISTLNYFNYIFLSMYRTGM